MMTNTSSVTPRIISGRASGRRPIGRTRWDTRSAVTGRWGGTGVGVGAGGGGRPRRGGSGGLGGADVDEAEAGQRDRLEVHEGGGIPGGRRVAVEQRVQRHLVGEQVEQLPPGLLLLGGVDRLQALLEQGLHLVVGGLALPVHAALGPDV